MKNVTCFFETIENITVYYSHSYSYSKNSYKIIIGNEFFRIE